MHTIETLKSIRWREVLFQKIRDYIEQIKQAIKQEALEVTKDSIQQYAFAPVKVHMKLSWMWNNVQSISKIILTEELEVKMHYKGDLPDQIEVITKEFKAWNTYIKNELHEEENDLSIWWFFVLLVVLSY